MHDFGFLVPIAVVAIVFSSRAFSTWVRAKHGYPLERDRRSRTPGVDHPTASPDAARRIELLSSENERLTGQIGRLEERLRVLERIATDPAERTAREIEALRDHSAN